MYGNVNISIGSEGQREPATETVKRQSFLSRFGPRTVFKTVASTARGLRDWVRDAPSKPLKAFRIVVVVGMLGGIICLGVAASKALPLVIAGGVLLGAGYLIYQGTRSNPT